MKVVFQVESPHNFVRYFEMAFKFLVAVFSFKSVDC